MTNEPRSVIKVDNHESVKIGRAGEEHGSDQGGQAEVQQGDIRESDHPSRERMN